MKKSWKLCKYCHTLIYFSAKYYQKSEKGDGLTTQRLLDGMQLLEYCELLPKMKITLQEYKMKCKDEVENIKQITKDIKLSEATQKLKEMKELIHDLKSFQLKFFETVLNAKDLVLFLRQTHDFKTQGLEYNIIC